MKCLPTEVVRAMKTTLRRKENVRKHARVNFIYSYDIYCIYLIRKIPVILSVILNAFNFCKVEGTSKQNHPEKCLKEGDKFPTMLCPLTNPCCPGLKCLPLLVGYLYARCGSDTMGNLRNKNLNKVLH